MASKHEVVACRKPAVTACATRATFMRVTFRARWRGGARAGVDRSVEALPVIRRSATKQGSIRGASLSLLFAVPLAGRRIGAYGAFRIWPQEESWTSAPPQE